LENHTYGASVVDAHHARSAKISCVRLRSVLGTVTVDHVAPWSVDLRIFVVVTPTSYAITVPSPSVARRQFAELVIVAILAIAVSVSGVLHTSPLAVRNTNAAPVHTTPCTAPVGVPVMPPALNVEGPVLVAHTSVPPASQAATNIDWSGADATPRGLYPPGSVDSVHPVTPTENTSSASVQKKNADEATPGDVSATTFVRPSTGFATSPPGSVAVRSVNETPLREL
jgi:hypothetical protein